MLSFQGMAMNNPTYSIRQTKVLAKLESLIALAEEQFNIVVPAINVFFNLKGSAAGQAIRYHGMYSIRINSELTESDSSFDHIYNDTIAHELAHIICYAYPTLGYKHNKGWQRVCLVLGGNGKRGHSEKVVFARGNTYAYLSTGGTEVRVSNIIHKKIQNGKTYVCKDNSRGLLDSTCTYTIVN